MQDIMKVKNMVKSKQSISSKLMQMSNKDFVKNLIVSVAAILLAFAASKITNTFFLCIVSILSLVLSGAETVFKLIKGTKDAKLDTLMIVVAVVIPFCLGNFVLAAYAMSIYKLSVTVISYLLANLGSGFRACANVCPQRANIVDSDSTVRIIPSSEIIKGTKIMIKTGETVPVDCIITEGFSDFDTSKVIDLGRNDSLSVGDKILAGYVNLGSAVTATAVCDYEDSLVFDMNRLADMAESAATVGEKRFIKLAKLYPVVILVISMIVLLICGLSTGSWGTGMSVVSVFLIAATTNSFMIAIPLFTSCVVWKLKKKGLAIASAEVLDEIADVNCVAFEKNGILTDGKFKILETYTAEGISKDDLLLMAGICVGGRTHPISRIFTKYKNEHLVAENVMEFPGKGIECTIMGKTFICGTEEFIKECEVDLSEAPGHNLYITIDKVLMGAFSYEDELAESSASDIELMRNVGVEKVTMFTSDKEEKAKIAFSASGADGYLAGLTSFARAEAVSKMKEEEGACCAYIGDALSGEQAINEADVGISLVSRETNGLEYSKIALLGKMKTLADAIEYARGANSKLEIHFYCASVVKIITVLLGAFGALNVATAIALDAILTIAALVSARELLKK